MGKPETAEGLAWGGATAGKFVYDEENEIYRAAIELATWNKVSFTWTDAEGVETILNYETATLAGLFTAADVSGADWTANLYHEVGDDGVDSATNGIFYTCTGGTYYAFYDPALNKLTVTDTDEIPVIAQVGTSVTLAGFEGAEFTWNGRVGAYECTVLVPKWTNFSLTYTDAEGVETAIWYDTATILGDVVATPVVGDQWTGVLFIDGDAQMAAHQWMNSNDGGATYKFVYDPVTKTLTVKFA